ncbi:MAG: hypothetical protein K6F99_00595 [Lachnospiraceae bacterium]|nr:hypothetical protein [Lachnospiraceae bacterium]
MIVEKELLSAKDAADLCGVKPNTFAMWRSRDEKNFPLPYAETAAGPVWKAVDIVAYLQRKFRDTLYDTIASGNLTSKRIGFIGRARVGKSFIISRFVEDRKAFVALFCGNNKDKTACPINVHISEQIQMNCYVFHSNFNSIYNGKDKADAELEALNAEISELVNRAHTMEEIDAMKQIEEVIRKIRSFEEKYDTLKNSDTYIDTYQKPSEYAKKLLRENKLGSIEFIDTPGVSGEVEASKIAKSDIYVFVLRPDNDDESKTLLKVVDSIKADVATSKVMYVYKIEGIYSSKEEYDEARAEVKEDIGAYEELFTDLKGNIISTDLALLNPKEHCIAFPTMNKEKPSFQEDLFMEDFMEGVNTAFRQGDRDVQNEHFAEIVKAHGDQARTLITSILSGIPAHTVSGDGGFETEQFVAQKHDRVMTGDNYVIHHGLARAYNDEAKLLFEYFSAFTADQYPEEWQQDIIKYLYETLSSSVRSDRGLGKGGHPWEEKPARTMLVEESILADQMITGLFDKNINSRNAPYIKILQDNNVKSATWNYVGCVDDKEAELKLKLIKECLLSRNVSSLDEMILYRYVGGLRFVALYSILALAGYGDNEIMSKLKTMPF